MTSNTKPKLEALPLEFGFWYLDWMNAEEGWSAFDVWEKQYRQHPEYWNMIERLGLEEEPETVDLIDVYAGSLESVKVPTWYLILFQLEIVAKHCYRLLGFKIKYAHELPWNVLDK
jgi:hypothetical protein